jgi:single-stranded DNA-binding protein
MNVITLTGRLHSNPVRRETTKGVVTTFRLTVDANRHRLWIDIEVWGHLAGTVHTHLTKGRPVAVTGSLRNTQYTDREHQRRDYWYVAADRITFLDLPTFDPPPEEKAPNGHVERSG